MIDLRVVLFASLLACSSSSAPKPSREAPSTETPRGAESADRAVQPIAMPPGVLDSGWTLHSATDGWWNAPHDEQLFINRIDIGAPFEGKSPAERAEILASVYVQSGVRSGGDARKARPSELPAVPGTSVACSYSTVKADHVHNLSCGFATPDSRPVISVEYSVYREMSDGEFAQRAQHLESQLGVAALRVPPPQ